MPAVHLLTDPTPGLTHVMVVCGARLPERGTWDVRAVTCPACLGTSLRSPAHASSAPGETEKQWLQQVRNLARPNGWMTYHPLRSQGSEAGWPDLALLKGPVLLCAELKVPGGGVTTAQQRWLDGLAQVRTIETAVWCPQDLETVIARLTQEG